YAAAARVHEANTPGLIRNADVSPNWLGDTGRVWYQKQNAGGSRVGVGGAGTGKASPAFDHQAVAAAADPGPAPPTPATAENLGLQTLRISADGRSLTGSTPAQRVTVNLEDRTVSTAELKPSPAGLLVSPTGRHGVKRDGDNLMLVEIATGHE